MATVKLEDASQMMDPGKLEELLQKQVLQEIAELSRIQHE
jgi:hypothetical protein